MCYLVYKMLKVDKIKMSISVSQSVKLLPQMFKTQRYPINYHRG